MNFNFIGVNEKIVNLDAIALIEDMTDGDGPAKAVLTTTQGAEIEFVGDDADALFARADFMMQTTDALLARIQAAEGVPQT